MGKILYKYNLKLNVREVVDQFGQGTSRYICHRTQWKIQTSRAHGGGRHFAFSESTVYIYLKF